jgi:polysaccharide export outer membrane protein
VFLPDYTISPPDVLLINVLRATPRPPYHIKVGDILTINVQGLPESQPIAAIFPVDPDGSVKLSYSYGSVEVADLTLKEAEDAIRVHLKPILKADVRITVSVSLAQSSALQQIRGEHLVRPDATIGLGVYGSVRVGGLTLEQAKQAIEAHLSQYLQRPEVSVDVSGFNSKVYYVIQDRPGLGDLVVKLPITGNERVLDAIAQTYGLAAASSHHRIWLSRPAPAGQGCHQVLPVDYAAITQSGATETNYQILPGDRVFIQSEPIIRADLMLARWISPIERLLGVTLLGSETVHSISIPLGQSTSGGTGGGVP